MTTSLPVRALGAGACMLESTNPAFPDGIMLSCALEAKLCEVLYGNNLEGVSFLSAHDVATLPSSHATRMCLDSYEVSKVPVGRCASLSDDYVCTGHPSACLLPGSFDVKDYWCQVLDDTETHSPVLNTKFGACTRRDENQFPSETECYWSIDDCDVSTDLSSGIGDFIWSTPSNRLYKDIPLCGCEDVKVGACQDPATSQYTCAVSADSCTPGHTFVDSKKLRASSDGIDCRLCRLPPGGRPSKPSTPSFSGDSGDPTLSSSSSAGDHNKTGLIVGVIVAIVIASLVTLLFWIKCRHKRQDCQDSTKDSADSEVPTDRSARDPGLEPQYPGAVVA